MLPSTGTRSASVSRRSPSAASSSEVAAPCLPLPFRQPTSKGGAAEKGMNWTVREVLVLMVLALQTFQLYSVELPQSVGSHTRLRPSLGVACPFMDACSPSVPRSMAWDVLGQKFSNGWALQKTISQSLCSMSRQTARTFKTHGGCEKQ